MKKTFDIEILKKIFGDDIKPLPSSKFQYENSVAYNGISIFNIFGFDTGVLVPKYKVIGYCNAENLSYRPKKDNLALLVELNEDYDFEQVWIHYSYSHYLRNALDLDIEIA